MRNCRRADARRGETVNSAAPLFFLCVPTARNKDFAQLREEKSQGGLKMSQLEALIQQDCPVILRDFLFYLQTILNRSPNTVLGYYYDLRVFFRFIKQKKKKVSKKIPFDKIPIADVDPDLIGSVCVADIYEYLYFISNDHQNQSMARSRKVSSLRTFYKYLTQKIHLFEYNPMLEIDNPNKPKRIVKYLTLEQSIELLKSTDGPYKERDYCILTFFLNCGLRLSELVGINESDIRGDRMVVTGKGNKQRTVYLNTACLEALERYRNYKKAHYSDQIKEKNALFLSRNHRRIAKRSVQMIVEKHLQQAHLDQMGFSTHKLRHTAATLMYQNGGVDVRTLQEILGHENLATTQIYTHVSNAQAQAAIDKNPLAKIHPSKDEK